VFTAGTNLVRPFGGGQRCVLSNRCDDLAVGVRGADRKLQEIFSTLEKSNESPVENIGDLVNEIAAANDSLDKMLSSLN
jgi:hypothetical protein